MIEKRIYFVTVLFFIFTLSVFSYGVSDTGEVQVIVSKANIRLKPDLNSSVITQVKIGTILKIKSKREDWYEVILPSENDGFERRGYIHKNIVELISNLSMKESREEPLNKKETAPDIRNEERTTEDKENIVINMDDINNPQRSEISDETRRNNKKGISPANKGFVFFGGGLAFPGGDMGEVFGLGLMADGGAGFTLIRGVPYKLDLIGGLDGAVFLRKSDFSEMNWTRVGAAVDIRFSYLMNNIELFAQGGLGAYLDMLDIYTYFTKTSGSEFNLGLRLGGGINFGRYGVKVINHFVDMSMFTILLNYNYSF